ncbi:winged helix-turn-helix transcriptional regulator [Pseudactinotalea suaedae]|uniref:winged helix-turn-helix transcriptional regulator n=1 Tax=Pseudactinotalea suaedae TaxID=1524924 RepID=UPI0012E1E3B8|nr:helix-turn-helix domain-containing protein [Pseudactinotalea suaedae]
MVTTTAARKKAEAKVQYDAFLAACPSRQLLDRVSGKWVILVLSALGSGPDCTGDPRPMRYSELGRVLAGVSPKMLSQTLKSLERDGLLQRTATATVPVTVTYELTDLGISLHQTLRMLKVWAERHSDEVAAHQAQFDAASQPAR